MIDYAIAAEDTKKLKDARAELKFDDVYQYDFDHYDEQWIPKFCGDGTKQETSQEYIKALH